MCARFLLTEKLYSGSFSVVHRARDAILGRDVVVKRCCDDARARREFRAMSELGAVGCRNIAALEVSRLVGDHEIENCRGKHKFYEQAYDHPSNLVVEYYAGAPSLCASDAEVAGVARDLLVGVSDIHEFGFIHCDVKRENIVFDGQSYRLIDFGLAVERPLARLHTYVRGTPFYLAPEIVLRGETSPMVDMYAAGVTIYALLHGGEHPIAEMNYTTGDKAIQRVIAGKSYDPARWRNADAPLAQDLCLRLLQRYPPARLTAKEALEHHLVADRRGDGDILHQLKA